MTSVSFQLTLEDYWELKAEICLYILVNALICYFFYPFFLKK